jgi:CheY-like chemotaxis protein/anti-sigma regulatory factor (Ser/Thr protein kinase)
MSPVQVEDLFRAIDGEFSSLAQQRNLRFKLFYPFKSMVLLTDHGLLMSVLRNLIDNAFKYTEQGGVLVGVRKRRGYGVIQVWDTGIGIDPIYGDQIFEECFQVGNVLHDRTKGLGIGLSIARRMARLLDGDVYYHSKPGQGSVFEIVLPLADDQVLSSNDALGQEQEDDADLEGLRYASVIGWRVVVIDDDPMVAKSIQLLLESLDVRVQVFSSAERALASPDILGADFYISDFSLPGASGLQLLDAIAQRSTAPVRAVLLTGETAPDRVAQAVSSRWPVLFKPANLSKLVAVMKNSKPQSGLEAS